MRYTALTPAQRKALPDTYGIPVNDAYTLRQEATRAKDEPAYDLDYTSATSELRTALNIGLENYGSGIASWRIPAIIKGTAGNNKPAQMWQLYVSQVCGAKHTTPQVNKAWKGYTKAQQQAITVLINEYLDDCLAHLQDNF